MSPPKEEKDGSDGDSVASTDGVKAKKNWMSKAPDPSKTKCVVATI